MAKVGYVAISFMLASTGGCQRPTAPSGRPPFRL
jgi:hypothetical protein